VQLDPLNDEQREIRELVRTLARERIAPRAAEIDKKGEFPWDVVELFREHELFGVLVDEEYGGLGASALMTLVAIEELAKVCGTSALILAVQELGALGLKLVGTDDQRAHFLPRLASGEWLGAYALTEPGSGSDWAAMRTTARRDGDERSEGVLRRRAEAPTRTPPANTTATSRIGTDPARPHQEELLPALASRPEASPDPVEPAASLACSRSSARLGTTRTRSFSTTLQGSKIVFTP